MKFILVRHAETTANTKRVILGGREGGVLSERGVRQAKAVAKRLAKEKILEVYCSAANRAVQTCELIAGGRTCKTHYCEELREIDMGELAGLSHEEAEEKYPMIFKDIFIRPDKKIPGGESILDVQKRAMPLIERLAEKPENPTILAVGHNIVNRVIIASLIGLPFECGKNVKQKNACISLLDVKPGFAQLYSLDNSLHSIR
ncbi:MAG: histidine phosphatase family protein [Candidatus Altiarchaeota archaeon]|nr:histidine phosphatase family protein [Candidatus Altiarchaeota archaeon]